MYLIDVPWTDLRTDSRPPIEDPLPLPCTSTTITTTTITAATTYSTTFSTSSTRTIYNNNFLLEDNNNNKTSNVLCLTVSNTRYHSIWLKVKENKNQIRIGSPMDRMRENSRGRLTWNNMCFEFWAECWKKYRITGVWWEGVPESWSNDRKGPLTQRCSDIWDGQNRWIRWFCRQRVKRKRETIVKIGRLLNLKWFKCKKTSL